MKHKIEKYDAEKQTFISEITPNKRKEPNN